MEQDTSHPTNRKVPAKEEGNAVPLCKAKPSPSYINLQASSPPATFLNIQTTKLPSVENIRKSAARVVEVRQQEELQVTANETLCQELATSPRNA
ncbi:TSSK6-activating co-chaperone protein isoform X4 [Lemur catta]|uniref:TSSK6-activating co-chaperone protein isoform X4 n=1 Tax=Lemur catta TaxID=9447 RepID=UPI001E26945F|nr:TSSK6-activating co-chaperone protein isoform X4 [Lemur catta]